MADARLVIPSVGIYRIPNECPRIQFCHSSIDSDEVGGVSGIKMAAMQVRDDVRFPLFIY